MCGKLSMCYILSPKRGTTHSKFNGIGRNANLICDSLLQSHIHNFSFIPQSMAKKSPERWILTNRLTDGRTDGRTYRVSKSKSWSLTYDLDNYWASRPYHVLTVYQVWLRLVKWCSVKSVHKVVTDCRTECPVTISPFANFVGQAENNLLLLS